MTTPVLSDMPDDADTADTADVLGHAVVHAALEADSAVWPSRHFSVDPASSPVLMAAFAWAATPAR